MLKAKTTLILLLMIFNAISQHPIFCSQQILNAVADSNYFNDSKTFVDLVLKVSVEEALAKFKIQNIPDWIQSNFIDADNIFQSVNLPDYQQFPQAFKNIKDQQLLKFALDLNKRWTELARKVNLQWKDNCHSDCSTFLPQINKRTIIIPGDRFKETYYWDTYWIIKGLITCGMLTTAENLIQNFIYIIASYGFIPNGFRLYYLNRSQPPFFGLMVKTLSDAYHEKGMKQKAEQLEKKIFPHLIAEHKYFMSTHAIQFKLKSMKIITLNVYNANTQTPRPQSFKNDRDLVSQIQDEKQRKKILKGINTMAQSGWDFSSRWLINPLDLKTNIINNIVPSDLNTIMALTQRYLTVLSSKFKREDLRQYYYSLSKNRQQYFSQRFNNQIYPDFKQSNIQQTSIYPSDFYPYLLFPNQKCNIRKFYNDIVNPVTSQIQNKMQWDKPNVWAPNNWILHQISNANDGFQLAQEWISTTYCSWKNQKLIYEKYRNDKIGQRGQGGQYKIQTGFGWTNGLALYYLQRYGSILKIPDC